MTPSRSRLLESRGKAYVSSSEPRRHSIPGNSIRPSELAEQRANQSPAPTRCLSDTNRRTPLNPTSIILARVLSAGRFAVDQTTVDHISTRPFALGGRCAIATLAVCVSLRRWRRPRRLTAIANVLRSRSPRARSESRLYHFDCAQRMDSGDFVSREGGCVSAHRDWVVSSERLAALAATCFRKP